MRQNNVSVPGRIQSNGQRTVPPSEFFLKKKDKKQKEGKNGESWQNVTFFFPNVGYFPKLGGTVGHKNHG